MRRRQKQCRKKPAERFKMPFPTFAPLFFVNHPVLRIPLALLLALLILFGGTAKEAVHQFADHTDTVHASCTSSCAETEDGLAFHTPHHHCDFLQLALAAFDAPPLLVFQFRKLPPKPAVRHCAVPEHLWLVRSFSFIVGRGPPIMLFA